MLGLHKNISSQACLYTQLGQVYGLRKFYLHDFFSVLKRLYELVMGTLEAGKNGVSTMGKGIVNIYFGAYSVLSFGIYFSMQSTSKDIIGTKFLLFCCFFSLWFVMFNNKNKLCFLSQEKTWNTGARGWQNGLIS